MSADDLLKLFSSAAFPSAVAIFVLWRLDRRLVEIAQTVHELALELARIRTGTTLPR